MALGGKHAFGSIEDTRVTFVEKGVIQDRKDFLKKLLEHNGFEVLLLPSCAHIIKPFRLTRKHHLL